MIDLKAKKLNKELRKIENQKLKTLSEIKELNKNLELKEKEFKKKFLAKNKKK